MLAFNWFAMWQCWETLLDGNTILRTQSGTKVGAWQIWYKGCPRIRSNSFLEVIYACTVDRINFLPFKFSKDSYAKHYDHKGHSVGVKVSCNPKWPSCILIVVLLHSLTALLLWNMNSEVQFTAQGLWGPMDRFQHLCMITLFFVKAQQIKIDSSGTEVHFTRSILQVLTVLVTEVMAASQIHFWLKLTTLTRTLKIHWTCLTKAQVH
jgi:hypothetical protein